MAIIDPEFKSNAKANAKGPLNFFWALLIAAIFMGLASKFLWSGYPPIIGWLEPWFELVGIVGLLGAAFVVADKNPLVK